MSTFSSALAGQIRAELARRGIAKKALAEAWGVSQPTATARIAGRVPLTVEQIEVAARVLGVDPWILIASAKPDPDERIPA